MQLTTRTIIVILLVMAASPGIAQVDRDVQTTQASVETMPLQHGSATLVGVTGVGSFTLAAPDLVLSGYLRDGSVSPLSCLPCTPGSSVGLRSSFGGVITAPLSWGSAQFLNQTLNLYFGGQLVFDADPIQVPALRSRRDIIITVPATLTGNVAGYFLNPFVTDPGPAVFLTSVNLQGTATVVLKLMDKSPMNNNRLYSFQSITYDFPPSVQSEEVKQ